MKNISPNIVWPMVIIALLLANITVAVGTLVVSKAKGGVQVVPNYYARAVAWDSLAVVEQNAVALGWSAQVTANLSNPVLSINFADSIGQPLGKLAAVVAVSRPQSSKPVGTFRLDPTSTPGEYRSDSVSFVGRGLYDFSITAIRDGQLFVDRQRIELSF